MFGNNVALLKLVERSPVIHQGCSMGHQVIPIGLLEDTYALPHHTTQYF